MTPLIDTYGRVHDNLRISVTDRCNIRCFYCMPEEGVKFQPREEILTFEEIERFVRVAVTLGVRKLRITGGEPLLRKDLAKLIHRLGAIEGIQDMALTTNGVLLPQLAAPLYEAGLRRINVHLDTIDRARFLQITRRDEIDKVLAGLEACKKLDSARPDAYFNEGILTQEYKAKGSGDTNKAVVVYQQAKGIFQTFQDKAGQERVRRRGQEEQRADARHRRHDHLPSGGRTDHARGERRGASGGRCGPTRGGRTCGPRSERICGGGAPGPAHEVTGTETFRPVLLSMRTRRCRDGESR